LLRADAEHILYIAEGDQATTKVTLPEFEQDYAGTVLLFAPAEKPVASDDAVSKPAPSFGFKWFVPELLKHKRIWRDVLLASLAIQLMALATPVFTQNQQCQAWLIA